jgi:hypothetical protein
MDTFVQTVLPEGRLQPQGLNVSPGMFGGQVGRTLEQAGNELERNAVRRQKLIDKARAEDVFSTQYAPAMADITGEI